MKMEIRKDAWHYRFFKIGHDACPPSRTNLCSYFWRTVFGLFLCTFIATLAVVGVSFLGWAFFIHTLTSIIVVLVVAAVIGGLAYWDVHKHDQREPSLVGAYVAARKSKMCPLITFTEVEDIEGDE
jgi:hypothetical protein